MPSPHVDDEKGKKAMIYKARKDRREGDGRKKGKKNTRREEKKENYISRACPKRLVARFHDRILNLLTLKSSILAQDQTSFLSCTL